MSEGTRKTVLSMASNSCPGLRQGTATMRFFVSLEGRVLGRRWPTV